MPRHFSAQHTANGFAAMGNHKNRPRSSNPSGRSVADAIAAARRTAARMAAASKKK